MRLCTADSCLAVPGMDGLIPVHHLVLSFSVQYVLSAVAGLGAAAKDAERAAEWGREAQRARVRKGL